MLDLPSPAIPPISHTPFHFPSPGWKSFHLCANLSLIPPSFPLFPLLTFSPLYLPSAKSIFYLKDHYHILNNIRFNKYEVQQFCGIPLAPVTAPTLSSKGLRDRVQEQKMSFFGIVEKGRGLVCLQWLWDRWSIRIISANQFINSHVLAPNPALCLFMGTVSGSDHVCTSSTQSPLTKRSSVQLQQHNTFQKQRRTPLEPSYPINWRERDRMGWNSRVYFLGFEVGKGEQRRGIERLWRQFLCKILGKLGEEREQMPKQRLKRLEECINKKIQRRPVSLQLLFNIFSKKFIQFQQLNQMFKYRTKDSSELLGSFVADHYTKSHIDSLRRLVILEKIYDWKLLSASLGTTVEAVRRLWQLIIYPTIKINEKIGGSVKWSHQQDEILRGYVKYKSGLWDEIAAFLPSRSPCSIEARWKRIMDKSVQCVSDVEAPIVIEMVVEDPISMDPEDLAPYQYRKGAILEIWTQYKTKLKKQSEAFTNCD